MKRRHAFTLVELMVSMALIIFIMAILSQAFMAALGTFRNLKGQGDMAEKLRSTSQILQRDLAANHFDGSRRLSDPTFWNNGPPPQGFFQLLHGSASTAESSLGDPGTGINSFLSTTHALSFTVRLAGNDLGDFMSASAVGSGAGSSLAGGLGLSAVQSLGPPEARYQLTSGGSYNYQWAAVAWYLAPQGRIDPVTNTFVQDTTVPDPTAGTGSIPLFQLYRRQCLLVQDNNLITLATNGAGVPSSQINNFLEISCLPDPNKSLSIIDFNSPREITMPASRGTTLTSANPPGILSGWGGQAPFTPIPATSPLLFGSDIQLNDVVSFDVRVLPMCPIVPLSNPPTMQQNAAPPNPADPFVTLFDPPFSTIYTYTPPVTGATYKVFDTWSSLSNGVNDYSNWNTTGTPGTSIPYWTTNALTYQYPVGTVQTITTPGIGSTIGSAPVVGSGPIIRAIQITLRIWDFKTNQTRQVTIVQAM